MSKSLLAYLSLTSSNAGACSGPGAWIEDGLAQPLVSINPTTGAPIAAVQRASEATYERIAARASESFRSWRERPAPKRGDLIRDLGNALREKKEALGDLVSLEMGKIRAEGHGEVQEMIDVCDFAVGLSRQLYGLTDRK